MNREPNQNQVRIDLMKKKLNSALQPSYMKITDDSHLHAGHVGAKSGKGHFSLDIISEQFTDLTRIKQHQLIYDALAEMMQDDIHALTIKSRA